MNVHILSIINLCRICLAFFLTTFVAQPAVADDSVEFANGSTMRGKILAIRKADREFDFRTSIAGRTIQRTYPYAKVHAVTINGKRFVLTPKNSSNGDSPGEKSKAEVMRIIEQQGGQPPDWLSSAPANWPKSLDLDWPLRAEGKWNESKNIGQYIWGRVNPNESRWKSGVRLVHECLDRHTGNVALTKRDMEKLGDMYFTLLQDYPRAAYWLQKANASSSKKIGVFLAECYWRLGNKPMAMKQLGTSSLNVGAIKLLGDMGEIEQAKRLADRFANTNGFNEAFLNAGDAFRTAGRLDEAIEYYQKVIDIKKARNPQYLKRYVARATESIEAIRLYDRADVQNVADGTYGGASTGYNGEMKIEVEVASGKIERVRVTQHREKQFYAAISDTTKQIVDKQGIQNIDGTSGATITSQAIVNATARALAKGAN